MSVLVKGIEMPKNCYDCPFIRASVAGDYYCVAGDGIEEDLNKLYERRMSDCPLVDSPEPHWIPVAERLPESKEDDLEYPTVLICFENEEIMIGCFYESTKEWGTGEYFDKKCDPIAWMPLPEPYKGVTE